MSTKFAMPPLADALPAERFEIVPGRDDIPAIVVQVEQLAETCRILRDHPALQFDVCLDVTAADYFPRAPRFHVVYHLVSVSKTFTLRVKVVIDDKTEVPTVSTVWPSANWQEREVGLSDAGETARAHGPAAAAHRRGVRGERRGGSAPSSVIGRQ
jgi:NADH:ubiquinone oxidoreductase subunit C